MRKIKDSDIIKDFGNDYILFIECQNCFTSLSQIVKGSPTKTRKQLVKRANKYGWKVVEDEAFCEECINDRN